MMTTKTKKGGDEMTCNNDCFNCGFKDCIVDNAKAKPVDEEKARKRKERRRQYNVRYRQEHKAEIAEKKRIYDKKYRQEHKEKLHQREVIRWQKIKAARAAAMGATSNV